jgi:delta-aminolevulinic acid dehydratase/porphobilinogen synthase
VKLLDFNDIYLLEEDIKTVVRRIESENQVSSEYALMQSAQNAGEINNHMFLMSPLLSHSAIHSPDSF